MRFEIAYRLALATQGAVIVFLSLCLMHKAEPEPVLLKPVVVLSHSYRKGAEPFALIYRARITNSTVLYVGPETNQHELKFDFIYGNRDGVYELDNNLR